MIRLRFLSNIALRPTFSMMIAFLWNSRPFVLALAISMNAVVVLFAQNEGPFEEKNIHSRLSRIELEELLYGSIGGSRQAYRRVRKDNIQRYVDRVKIVCGLSDTQIQKVKSAIDIDILRTETEIASLLSSINEKTLSDQKQQTFNTAWRSIQLIQQRLATEESSLWNKVLQSQLTETQRKALELDTEEIEQRKVAIEKQKTFLLLQRKAGLIAHERKSLQEFIDTLPNSQSINIFDVIRKLNQLSIEDRRKIVGDKAFNKMLAPSNAVPNVLPVGELEAPNQELPK